MGASLKVNGVAVELNLRKGYAAVDRVWQAGDKVTLDLPMDVQFVRSHPRVRETIGKVAVQRGPLVYCAEQADNGPELHGLVLEPSQKAAVEAMTGLGTGTLALRVSGLRVATPSTNDPFLTKPPTERDTVVTLVPYHLWGNRGEGEMRVWMRVRG